MRRRRLRELRAIAYVVIVTSLTLSRIGAAQDTTTPAASDATASATIATPAGGEAADGGAPAAPTAESVPPVTETRPPLDVSPIERIVVLPISVTSGIDQSKGELVDDMLLTEMTRRVPINITVIGSKDVTAMLGLEQQKMITGCTDSACLVEIGNALGASHLLNTTIGRLGERFVFNLTLLDVIKAKPVHRDSLYLGTTEEELINAVQVLADNVVASRGFRASTGDVAVATPSEPTPGDPGSTAGEAQGGDADVLLITAAVVGGVGLVATTGFGVATFVINQTILDNPDQDNLSLAQVGLGTVIGTGLSGVALAAGATMLTIALLSDSPEDEEEAP